MTEELKASIALWGPPRSGKTAMLAALPVAANAQGWTVVGSSTGAFGDLTRTMIEEHKFNEATRVASDHTIVFRGDARLSDGTIERIMVRVSMRDVPGEAYNPPRRVADYAGPQQSAAGPSASGTLDKQLQDLVDHLAGCDALVFTFDPTRQASSGDTMTYLNDVLARLAHTMQEKGNYTDYLPQRLAVCVTKYDDYDVFAKARRAGFGTQDAQPPHLPRVRREHAGEFFRWLCEDDPDTHNAADVRAALLAYFKPGRIDYFVVSAVGFGLHDGRFDPDHDFSIVEPVPDGVTKITGKIRPVNVIEPFEWLAARMLEEQRA
ncbi:hypothetical protein AB0B31_35420 [Catellatospora citrea]|uniref:hypothetical protein n=1 Tax=Catellatospora citrea TaxID=53366 RepID=UPI0033DB1BAC